jgi:hypothetical protein
MHGQTITLRHTPLRKLPKATQGNSPTASLATVVATSRYRGSPRLPCSLVRSSTAIFLADLGRPAMKCSADQGLYRCTFSRPTCGDTQGANTVR